MTCVEFFDNNVIENIFTCLTVKPDRVILIGDVGRTLEAHAVRYSNFIKEKGLDMEFCYCTIPKNDRAAIVDRLCRIVEEYDDCIFDLTGGEEMYIAAAGMINERYSDRGIQMHRVNYLNGKAYDIDGDRQVVSEKDMPELTVEDCIKLYGGKIAKNGRSAFTADTQSISDINALWDICREDPTAWNRQIGILAAAEAATDGDDPLKTSVPDAFIRKKLSVEGIDYSRFRRILDGLIKAKLIQTGFTEDDRFTVRYKNAAIKDCLTVSGRALEMQLYIAALNLKKKGELFYNDVENNVVIDWDGADECDSTDAVNEIDVMMMRGVVPVFVSCKNGKFKSDELYKLNSVAARFGGKYAKKVLAVANPVDTGYDSHILQRAKEMHIKIIDNLCTLDSGGIIKELRKFWS